MTKDVDAFDRLTLFGWRGGVAAALLLSLVSFLNVGYFTVYWRNADMDFMVIYNALAMNDGGAQAFFDHPAYLTILSVKTWFALLHRLGLLDAWTLSAIPADRAAFDAAMTSAVHAGRVAALLTAACIILAFAWAARRLVSDWRVAMLAVTAFAFSGGVQMHLRILRSEMIAASFCILALMILMVVARRASHARPLAIGLAAALCMLGLENKVHAILLIAAIPVLVLPFGTATSGSVAFWRTPFAWAAVLVAAVAALLAGIAAWPLIAAGFDPVHVTAAGLKPMLFGRFGVYQFALLGVIAACVYVFGAMTQYTIGQLLDRHALKTVALPLSLVLAPLLYLAADARDWALIVASIGIVMGAFGQVTVNDAMVGKYTSEEWRSRAYAVRYFIGFTAAGASVGLVAWLYERGGFVTMLQAFAALCLVAIVAALILPPELPAAQAALREAPAE